MAKPRWVAFLRLLTAPSDNVTNYAHPLRAGRHPFQVYLLFLGLLSAVPAILTGDVSAPAVDTEVYPAVAYAWNSILVVGSTTALVGIFWRGKRIEDGLTMERIGLGLVGITAFIYGALILVTLGPLAMVGSVIVLAYGLACIRRARDIGALIQRATEYAELKRAYRKDGGAR